MVRDSKTHKSYHGKGAKRRSQKGCPLCNNVRNHILEETKNFYVVTNIYPYQYWDVQGVTGHQMIIPKKHIKSISDLKSKQRLELIDLIADYEAKGLNMYSRGDHNAYKSIPDHLHIHLIDLDQKLIKRLAYNSKPYILKAKQ